MSGQVNCPKDQKAKTPKNRSRAIQTNRSKLVNRIKKRMSTEVRQIYGDLVPQEGLSIQTLYLLLLAQIARLQNDLLIQGENVASSTFKHWLEAIREARQLALAEKDLHPDLFPDVVQVEHVRRYDTHQLVSTMQKAIDEGDLRWTPPPDFGQESTTDYVESDDE